MKPAASSESVAPAPYRFLLPGGALRDPNEKVGVVTYDVFDRPLTLAAHEHRLSDEAPRAVGRDLIEFVGNPVNPGSAAPRVKDQAQEPFPRRRIPANSNMPFAEIGSQERLGSPREGGLSSPYRSSRLPQDTVLSDGVRTKTPIRIKDAKGTPPRPK